MKIQCKFQIDSVHVGGVYMSLVGGRRACSTASLHCFGRLFAYATLEKETSSVWLNRPNIASKEEEEEQEQQPEQEEQEEQEEEEVETQERATTNFGYIP